MFVLQKLNMAMAWSLPPLVMPASIQIGALKEPDQQSGLDALVNPAGVVPSRDEKPGRERPVVVTVGGDSEL